MICPNCGKAFIRKEENYFEGVLYCPNCGVGLVFDQRFGMNTSNDVLSFPSWFEGDKK